MITITNLIDAATLFIGDGAKDNPEYARAMVELTAAVIPGEQDEAESYVMSLLNIQAEDLTPSER